MARIIITDGTIQADLSNLDPDISLASEQLTINYPLIGTNSGEVEDLMTFSDVITISCILTDGVLIYNTLQALRTLSCLDPGPSYHPISLEWNDNESSKPALDHSNNTGTVKAIIASASLHQAPGTPANQYEIILKLALHIPAA